MTYSTGEIFLAQFSGISSLSSLSIRRFWGKRGKMEAKKGRPDTQASL